MRLICGSLAVLGVLGILAGPGRAADSPAPAVKPLPDALRLAVRIDQLIAAGYAAKGAQPAQVADDAEFLRRVYLDLAGRIPRAFEGRDFLEDASTHKRLRVWGSLLESPAYVNHFTNIWRSLLLPQSSNAQVAIDLPGFEGWLRRKLRDNTPYDALVRELLTASASAPSLRRNRMMALADPTPAAFYQANELKPENLAGSTSRLFLGIKLECAQCHDHPH